MSSVSGNGTIKDQETDATVYFNSACPVCKSGIEFQKQRSKECSIGWTDVHLENELCEEIGVDLETARKYLHLRLADGTLLIGIDAFVYLWRNSTRQKWLAHIFELPGVHFLSIKSYRLFAGVLYRINLLKKNWSVE